MFRHAFINQLKGCGNAPFPIAEATKGRGRNASEFARYGSEGYTPYQKNSDGEDFDLIIGFSVTSNLISKFKSIEPASTIPKKMI
jgi:hypothetical protein